jgi:hypothetical protein
VRLPGSVLHSALSAAPSNVGVRSAVSDAMSRCSARFPATTRSARHRVLGCVLAGATINKQLCARAYALIVMPVPVPVMLALALTSV